MLRRFALVLGLFYLSSCGGSSPTQPTPTPTPPTPTTHVLSGTVTDGAGAPLGGATVTVVDGPGANKSGDTDGAGHYTISGVQGGFTARARKPYYTEQSQGVTVGTSDVSKNFQIAFIPPFSRAGTGDNVFDLPATVNRVHITGQYPRDCSNFVVWIAGDLKVNVIIGTCSIADAPTYDGVIATPGGGTVQIQISSGVNWVFTEVR